MGEWSEVRERMTRQYLVRLLAKHGGNRTRAAAELDMPRTQLLRLIKRYDLPKGAR